MKKNTNPLKNFDSATMTDVICPNCKEKVSPQDLEVYPRCPYCDYQFKSDNSLEDFVLSPLLKRWVVSTTQRFIR